MAILVSAFEKAMDNFTYTENGALSYNNPGSSIYQGRLSLFYKTARGISEDKLENYLKQASKEDLIDTIILAFYTRDPRGGKGERSLGRKMFQFIFENHPFDFFRIMELIPEYGRWDDILEFFPNKMACIDENQINLQKCIINMFCNQLKEDIKLMKQGKPISLCAKWAPTENDSFDRKYHAVNEICKKLKITKAEYRKKIITPLRSYLKVVETYMCTNRWDEIDFGKVPSCAMKILRKAFEKHTPVEFSEWKQKLIDGIEKVNAKVLHPHEIIKELRNGDYDQVLEAQWNVLEDETKKLGTLSDCVIVVDTSSSMHTPKYLPLDVAVSLGILISGCVEGEFKNHVITFNTVPKFVKIREGNLYDRYNQVKNIDWGGSTNIQATFDMILDKAKAANLTDKQMPKRLFIISDMQFDNCNGYGYKTNFNLINEKYKNSGYTRPNIVFWNVNGAYDDFPVTIDDNGTCLVSGFSPSILKNILRCKELNSENILKESLNSERYKIIRNLLEKFN